MDSFSPFSVEFEEEVCFQAADDKVQAEVSHEHLVEEAEVLHPGKSPGDHGRERQAPVAQHLGLELQTIHRRSCTITEKAPTWAFFWLKVPTSDSTCKNLFRCYAKPKVSRHKIGLLT